MGDSDGHHKNILVDEHGNVWNMDFDRAIPEGRVSGHFGDWEYESEEQLIEGTIRFAHGRVEKADRRLLSPDFIAHKVWNNSLRRKENYGWMARADQLIRLDDVEDQIARLEKLKSENYRKELIVKFTEAGIDKDNAEDMVDALGQRAEVLRKTIEKETVFGNGPIDISLLFDLSPTKHAMAPMPGTGASLRIAA